tara:strand:+ start:23 stop:319 length:297 start_codon:yes stop_codon:yes gene_type:complete
MKTFKQFQESIGAIRILPAIGKLVKFGAAAYGVKKGAEFLGRKSVESNTNQDSKSKYRTYENPSDGSIPGRYSDETITDYKKRRNKGLQNQINKINNP